MASSYVNDLRLNEMATGDASGTWGETTNTNLELIAEAFSYGTEAITTNADTHTTTIADGATDPGRSMYLKYTGTLDSACTITIGPNTVSKVWIIENGTSGSQNIIISQGSGANITIPAGDTKVVYSDGAGAGAAFFDAFASLNVVDLKVQDDLTVTDDASIGGDATITGTLGVTGVFTGTSLDISGDIDVDGTTNLDVVDIDGAVDMATTLAVAGNVDFNGDLDVDGTANLDVVDIDGAVDMATTLAVAGNVDFNGDLDVDGTANLDVVDIDGAVDMASTLTVGSTITINEPTQTTFGLVSKVKSVYLSSTDATYANLTIRKEAATSTDYLQIRDSGNDLLANLTSLGGLITAPTAGGHTVFNENSVDADFRVESDTNTHALFVDAGTDVLTLGYSARNDAFVDKAATGFQIGTPGVDDNGGHMFMTQTAPESTWMDICACHDDGATGVLFLIHAVRSLDQNRSYGALVRYAYPSTFNVMSVNEQNTTMAYRVSGNVLQYQFTSPGPYVVNLTIMAAG
jgi:cytoskeletal protein CcmA (bactofilin family)